MYTKGGFSNFDVADATRILLPLADPDTLRMQGAIPDETASKNYLKKLEADFDEQWKADGHLPADKSCPAYYWAHHYAVEIPYWAYAKMDTTEFTTYRQRTAADILAQGESGPDASAKYLAMVHNQVTLKALARGIDGKSKGGVDTSTPLFSNMSIEEKKLNSWNSTYEAEHRWRVWSLAKLAADEYVASLDKSSQSKAADQVRAELEALGEKYAGEYPTFKREWEFSHLPLEDRMRQLNIGSTDSEADKGWNEFFGIVDDYKTELANTWNTSTRELGVGPQSQAAAKIVEKYLEKLQGSRLKERYPDWWNQFNNLFPLSSFGFYSKWQYKEGGGLVAPDYSWAVKQDQQPITADTTIGGGD
jgi:hypothetical protein